MKELSLIHDADGVPLDPGDIVTMPTKKVDGRPNGNAYAVIVSQNPKRNTPWRLHKRADPVTHP
jgi:hypothetical protein